jgi:hypothetical protein
MMEMANGNFLGGMMDMGAGMMNVRQGNAEMGMGMRDMNMGNY